MDLLKVFATVPSLSLDLTSSCSSLIVIVVPAGFFSALPLSFSIGKVQSPRSLSF